MTTPLFKKLNLGAAQIIHVLNAPASFETELAALNEVDVSREATGRVSFALTFVKTLAEVERATELLTRDTADDVTLWMAYPKGSSKRYTCEFNRDTGWAALGRAGYEPVRQVAIDEDWSALRFRRVEYIKSMKRDPARTLSSAGRSRASESVHDGVTPTPDGAL